MIAVFDLNEPLHGWATDLLDTFYEDHRLNLVTTRAVLNEFLAHFSRGDGITRVKAASVARDLLDDPKYAVTTVNDETYLDALNLYRNRPDKRYSMVDCIGMTVMRQLGIEEVVATDRDFEQEGFRNLMRPDRRSGIS